MSATEIIPRLSVGNWQSAKNAPAGTYIITVARDAPFVGRLKFDLVDGPGNDLKTWNDAVEAVVSCYNSGHNILVHCVSGRSRSVGVTVAALKRIKRINIYEAYDWVKAHRDETSIHPAISDLMLDALDQEEAARLKNGS